MKRDIHSNDFGALADKGWRDLSDKLDRELPVKAAPINGFPFRKAAVVLALLCGVLLLSLMLSLQKSTRAPFQPIPKIVSHISFDVHQPDIVINWIEPTPTSTYLAAKKPITLHNVFTPTSVASYKKNENQADLSNKTIGLRYISGNYTTTLPNAMASVQSNWTDEVSIQQKQINLQQIAQSPRHTRLGVNLSSATHGMLQSASVGGGISVSFPLGKRFSVEPGVGYDMMRFKELPAQRKESEFSLARVVMATPSLNVKYRVRKSIEMPLSIHYQPIRQLALTGGVDVGLLISQRMVFESSNYSGLEAYKNQLNESELNQLNRVNIGAHGGVSWFPSADWKLGLYYGQNLTNPRKEQNKLKFSNHIFKVRMARYF